MQQSTQRQSLWLSPVGYFLYGVLLLACVTSMLLLWKVKQRHAERAFEQFVVKAEALADPHEALRLYDDYVRGHRDNELTRRAQQKARDTQDRVARYDFDQALQAVGQTGDNHESAMQIWQAYLNGQPAAQYRKQAEARLQELPARIDDRDFAQITRQYPAGSPSLEARQAALQDYLARYPQGRHLDAARKAIAQIPDALDQRTYQALADEVASLVAAGRIVAAIECLEAKAGTVTAQPRKDQLQRTSKTLVAALEQQDLEKIRSAPLAEAAQQRSLLSTCRLFLLSYPTSQRAADVRKRIATIVENLGISEWRSLQQTLDTSADKPDVCLHALDDYFRLWPDAQSVETIRKAACACYARIYLGRLASLALPQTGTIVRKDGTGVTGVIEELKDIYKVVDPATGKRLPSVWKNDVQSYTPSESAQAVISLRQQMATLDPSNPDRAVLRSAATLSRKHEFKQATWLLCSLLARIDDENAETQQLLETSGFWRVGRRWLSQDDMSDSTILARLVDSFGHNVVDGVKQTMQQLPLTVKFTRLGVDEKVPVDCTTSLAGADLQSKQQDAAGLKANVRFRFSVSLQPQAGVTDTQSVGKVVADIASQAQCEAILEIAEERTKHDGAGVAIELRAGKWVISQLDAKGPASSAWIEAGDTILAVNGRTLDEQTPLQELTDALAGTAGEVELKLRRSDRTFRVKIAKSEWTESVFQGRYYIRHNLNSAGTLQFLPQTSLPPVSAF